jgi:hypothetical protein
LPKIIGEVGMAWLLGCIRSVAIAWAGHWGAMLKPQVPAIDAYAFTLSQRHLKALLDVSAVNRAANQLPAPANQDEWIKRCQTITAHVQRAQGHGLSLLDDLVCFALHAMQHHPKFDQHQRIAQLLATLKKSAPADELDYQELSCRISVGEWQTIVQELSAHSAN